jgi:hypothetical protein
MTAHQIWGLIVTIAMLAQFVLGYLHHRMYKKTLQTTKLAPIHVWLGRLVIPLGVLDGFLGFPLALYPKYDGAYAAIVAVLVIITAGTFYFWRRRQLMSKTNDGIPRSFTPSQGDLNISRPNEIDMYRMNPLGPASPRQDLPNQSRQFV